MSLHAKLSAILFGFALFAVALCFSFSRLFLYPALNEMDAERAEKRLTGALNLLNEDLAFLQRACSEQAVNPEFIEMLNGVLDDGHMHTPWTARDFDLVAIGGIEGGVRYFKRPLEGEELKAVVLEALQKESTGISAVLQKPILLTSSFVYSENKKIGCLVIGRFLEENRVKKYVNGDRLIINHFSRHLMDPGFKENLTVFEPFVVPTQNAKNIRVSALLQGVNGEIDLIATLVTPRTGYQALLSSQTRSYIAALIICLAAAGGLFFFIVRRFIKPLHTAIQVMTPFCDNRKDAYADDPVCLSTCAQQVARKLKENKSALADVERKFREVFEASIDAIILENFEEELFCCNSAARQLFQRSEAEMMELSLSDLITTNTDEILESILGRRADSSSPSILAEGRKADGSQFPVNVLVTPLSIEDRPALMWIIRDISNQKLAEKSLRHHEEVMEKHNRYLVSLGQDDERINEGGNALFDKVAESSAIELKADCISVWIADSAVTEMECKACFQLGKGKCKTDKRINLNDGRGYFKTLEYVRVLGTCGEEINRRLGELKHTDFSHPEMSCRLDIPIRVGGKPLGIICCENINEKDWSISEKLYMASVADFVALALESKRKKQAEESLKAREKIMKSVAASAEMLLQPIPWENIIDSIFNELADGAKLYRIALIRRNGDAMEYVREWNSSKMKKRSSRLPWDKNQTLAWKKQLSDGEVVYGKTEKPFSLPTKNKDTSILSDLLIIPVFVRGSQWGAVEFFTSANRDEWMETEIDALRTAVSLLGEAMNRMEIENQLLYLNETFFNLGPEFDRNLRILTEAAGTLLNAECTQYQYLEANMLKTAGSWNFPGTTTQRKAEAGSLAFEVISRSKHPGMEVIKNLSASSFSKTDPDVADNNYKTYVGFPVLRHGACIGVLNVFYKTEIEFNAANQKVIEILATAIGIEEERKYVREARDRLSAAVEQSAEAVLMTDANGVIQYVNPAFSRITGYQADEVCGQRPSILKSGKHGQEFYQTMRSTLDQGEAWAGHLVNKRKDGTLYEAEGTISPVRDSAGNFVNYVAVTRDVTEQSALHAQLQQAQKMEAVGQLAGGVAHDFNNLLTVVTMNAEFIKMIVGKDAPVSSNIDEILNASENAGNLTRQLLAFARKQAFKPVIINLNDVILQMDKMLRRLLREDIELIVKPHPELMPVEVDKGQIQQVIVNLVVNARDAIAKKTGQIKIETIMRSISKPDNTLSYEVDQGEYIELRVSDNGKGMAEDTLQHIFEPFFSTKGPEKGTGLGLATVYGIIRQHNGYIFVESEVNAGTVFTILIPLAEEEHTKTSEPLKGLSLPQGTETIMVVEDLDSLRSICAVLLKKLGYKVIEACDGKEALQKAETFKGTIDLLLTDVIMPQVNGRTLAAQLLKKRPEIKVIFVSGYADLLTVKDLEVCEYVYFIQKPFDPRLIGHRVREMLDGKLSMHEDETSSLLLPEENK